MTPAFANEQLAEKTRTSAVGHAVLLAISWAGVRSPDNTVQVAWFALVILSLSFGRLAVGRPGADPRAAVRWFYAYGLFTVATGLAWGFFAAASILSNGAGHRSSLLLLIVNAGIAAAGSNSLSANRRLASLFTFAVLAPISIALGHQDPYAFGPVIAMLVTYQGFLVFQIASTHRMIQRLRERETQYRTLVDATHESILVHRDGVILEVNAAFERTFGYAPAGVIGRNAYDLVHPEERGEAERRARQDDGERSLARLRHQSGHYLTVEVRARDIVYRGEPARMACVNDITAQIAAEEQRRRLAEDRETDARETLRLKSDFLANVSHEMRTPLNGIIGLTDLLAEAPEGEARRQYLARLRASGQNLLTMINELLDFTEIDAGRIEFTEDAFALTSLVEAQVALIEVPARAKGIEVTTKLDSNLPESVRGDQRRIGQVLSHLLGNALKFTAEGRVIVRCFALKKDAGTARVRIEVEDTGSGIAPELVARIFNPFTQGDSSTSRRFGGSGLGLSICKRLVDGLGGQIGFLGGDGGGTRFWFEIPLALAAATPPAVRPTHVKFRPARLLVVEDNSTNQVLILAVLSALGLKSFAVGNGVECLETLRENAFDLILMDCQMPEMDGFEATRQIRAREAIEGGHVPIVALTANVMQEDRERCFASGMDAFVPKPVKRDLLIAELSRFLKTTGDDGVKAS